jgi:hypothetical protein
MGTRSKRTCFGSTWARSCSVLAVAAACGGHVGSGQNNSAGTKIDAGDAKHSSSGDVANFASSDAGSTTLPVVPFPPQQTEPGIDASVDDWNWWSDYACYASSTEGFLECEFPLEGSLSNPEWLEFTNIRLVESVERVDASASTHLTYVGELTRCAEEGMGWYVDSRIAPARITVCPLACQRVNPSPEAWFVHELGCARLSLPGEEPRPLPQPLCAASRPASCPDLRGGSSSAIQQCNQLGDDSLAVWDLDLVNVTLVPSGDPSLNAPGRGYVQHVASAADCGSVVEGWYFEPSANPPRISVCPTTCACLRSMPGANFMVEVGCPRWEGAP